MYVKLNEQIVTVEQSVVHIFVFALINVLHCSKILKQTTLLCYRHKKFTDIVHCLFYPKSYNFTASDGVRNNFTMKGPFLTSYGAR